MKLVISDLDGTLLLKGEYKLHRLTIYAIERILESNNIFCVASGRSYSELKRIFADFDDKICFIANDGALAVYNGHTLFDFPIPKSALQSFDCEESFAAHGKYLSFIKSDSEMFTRNVKRQYSGHAVSISDSSEITEPIYKVSLYGKESNASVLDRVYKSNALCEYVNKGINKGFALVQLAKLLKTDDTIAIGDSLNDIEMLKAAGKSFVISTAPPKVKKTGDLIVKDFTEFTDIILEG